MDPPGVPRNIRFEEGLNLGEVFLAASGNLWETLGLHWQILGVSEHAWNSGNLWDSPEPLGGSGADSGSLWGFSGCSGRLWEVDFNTPEERNSDFILVLLKHSDFSALA